MVEATQRVGQTKSAAKETPAEVSQASMKTRSQLDKGITKAAIDESTIRVAMGQLEQAVRDFSKVSIA
ncbi:MAG: hypothetical protein NTZ10_03740 [Candidatus Saganbacteria bacterium]|nr:hypothetical protein [Candidatus Saganbacteria bacterium]